jgi:hypothetical protein
MTDLMEKALAAIGRRPTARQDEAAEMLLALAPRRNLCRKRR